jgi:kynureninase
MALTTIVAFGAGFVSGWVGRSVAGSTREALVQALVAAHKVRDGVRRVVAEQVEWAEDLLAEGRARYEQISASSPIDVEIPPQVVGIEKRGRAA